MKKMLLAMFVTMFSCLHSNAQYDDAMFYNWMMQQQQINNQMSMQNAMMQQQIVNFYRQQAQNVNQQFMNNPTQPIRGNFLTYDGDIFNYETVQQMRKEHKKEKKSTKNCSMCGGSGKIIRNSNPPMYGKKDSKKYCSICERSYWRSDGHSHISCPVCK